MSHILWVQTKVLALLPPRHAVQQHTKRSNTDYNAGSTPTPQHPLPLPITEPAAKKTGDVHEPQAHLQPMLFAMPDSFHTSTSFSAPSPRGPFCSVTRTGGALPPSPSALPAV